MNIVYWLSGIALFIIASVSCYTDIKYGKISNKVIFFGFIFAIAFYIFLLVDNYIFFGKPENVMYVAKMATNRMMSLIDAYALWKFNFWSAGDAKLFAIYAAIMPLEVYSNGAVQRFLPFNLLINLFFPILIVLLIKAAIFAGNNLVQKIREKKVLELIKGNVTYGSAKKLLISIGRNLLDFVFMYVVFSWIFSLIGTFSGGKISLDPFVMYFCMLFLVRQLEKVKRKFKFVGPGIYVSIMAYILYLAGIGDFETLKSIAFFATVFMVLIGFTRYVLRIYIEVGETKKVKIKDLEEGMVIYNDELSAIRNLAEEQGKKDKFDFLGQGGVRKDQIALIKELFKEREETIFRVYSSFPFAPFLSLAAILTFVTKASFLNLLAILMQLNKK